ncbi:hydroxymethylglutaryl-CoA lyase [Tropicimonas sediminicola]|uniref:Hydroxymethylglutaryl-CoA lyase n=1 Tax=Tropicimonas sediminicola TaxID=1031541 RepID=A0A239HH69_9RHOB|nr:hydroxymethylglutaryl-CoA lyase [Tropicimonas sediminicola]SNS80398.1 hydroxymethylglutaryl-CoA lyase [Tropicimonas sediminicola]
MNAFVEIFEVGPRDGLQNEARAIPLAEKVALIDLLSQAGFRRIEVASFVSPKWVPQMAGSDEVLARISRKAGVSYAALVPNARGLERAIAARADEVAVFVSASEGFSQANLNCSIDESFDRLGPVIAGAEASDLPVRGYVSCVTDCPFDGPVAPDRVAAVVRRLAALGVYEVSLGDTLGQATPERIGAMLDAVLGEAPADRLAGHYHDTAGRALANIEVSLERGLRVFDASVGGLGGCPYAPGAAGNVATEAVLARLTALGYRTGLDPDIVARAAEMAKGMRGRPG